MSGKWNGTSPKQDGGFMRSGFNIVHVAVAVALTLSAAVLVTRRLEPLPSASGDVSSLRHAAREAMAVALDVDLVAERAESGALPRLRPDAAGAALASFARARTDVRGQTRLMGDVSGLIVVHPGARLVLEDVVLKGSLISAGALAGDPTGAPPSVTVVGSLRIDPVDALPDVAVLMPEGMLRAEDASSSIQLRGDVVVRAVHLAGHGSVMGRLASATPAQISPRVLLADPERTGVTWSDALAVSGSSSVAQQSASRPSWDEVASMQGFQFPDSAGR